MQDVDSRSTWPLMSKTAKQTRCCLWGPAEVMTAGYLSGSADHATQSSALVYLISWPHCDPITAASFLYCLPNFVQTAHL